ncbi:MAG TPA: family 20 glycosylhydrolase [Bacteroidales bacterium]|nr:family 20 glycosylhydrolase [Bacteroidales bacterium]
MKKKTIIPPILFSFLALNTLAFAQTSSEKVFQVKGFSCTSPRHNEVDRFVKFIDEELASQGVNTLVVFVCDKDYNYQFESYPQLGDPAALSKADVKKMVAVCKKNNIRIIPQINLLGHQSWKEKPNKLLEKFPEFDETPYIKIPEKYVWPNSDDLYCKSYCPLHPDLHKVLFAIIDEICDVFEADAFHAGMDEVFYLGDEKCPRCAGVDKAELFAGEVTKIRNHLAEKNRELWIWGDRLIDGKSTGIGLWEASYNYTWRAIDMIPKDVVICDWHYERADQTPVYFAMKGFRVITSTGRKPETSVIQTEDMARFRKNTTKEMKPRYYGMMQTVWSSTDQFIDAFYGKQPANATGRGNPADGFKAMFRRIDEIEKGN